MNGDRKQLVVCLGASIVRGQFSVNFVDLLKRRMGKDGFQFINAGVNGDLSYNVLCRLDAVLAHKPDFIAILVGTNDITGALNSRVGRSMRAQKKLPDVPSMPWYRENMLEIVRRLKQGSTARLALCSLPHLGENLDSAMNAAVRSYNAILAEIARQEQVSYIPVQECQAEYLREHGAGRMLTHEMLIPMTIKFLLFHYVLRYSLDRISRRNGFLLTVEGVHMNSAGAAIIADQIESFLRL
jgi:lysophospholipase L1-like esterase